MNLARLTRRTTRLLLLAVALAALTACGAAPQGTPEQATAVPATAIPANPAPTASPEVTYPAPQGGAPTSYPAPQGGAPTAYPPPLGGASERPTAAPAPTGSGQGGAPSLPAGFDPGPIPAARAAAALADMLQRAGVTAEAVSVVAAEAVEWRDGSIGCPRDGMMYPQVITPGYRLLLAAGGQEYAYHATQDGELFYCATPTQ
jgi:hypothetical protein